MASSLASFVVRVRYPFRMRDSFPLGCALRYVGRPRVTLAFLLQVAGISCLCGLGAEGVFLREVDLSMEKASLRASTSKPHPSEALLP
eukprot:4669583-Heterocapsa_arctica.AAC.1